MNITKRHSDNVNYNLNIILLTKLSYFLLKSFWKITGKKRSSQTAMPFLNKLDLQQQ